MNFLRRKIEASMMSTIRVTWRKEAQLTGRNKTIFWTTNSRRNRAKKKNLSVSGRWEMLGKKWFRENEKVVGRKRMGCQLSMDWKIPSSISKNLILFFFFLPQRNNYLIQWCLLIIIFLMTKEKQFLEKIFCQPWNSFSILETFCFFSTTLLILCKRNLSRVKEFK